MTGIRISEPRPWRLLLLASVLPAGLHADNLTLEGDARLTGSVRSISDQGVVELTTPL